MEDQSSIESKNLCVDSTEKQDPYSGQSYEKGMAGGGELRFLHGGARDCAPPFCWLR